MRILLYQGKSFVSKLIKWQTRSKYSHVAIELKSGQVIEAWHKGGVQLRDNINQGHKKGTHIDCFKVTKRVNQQLVEDFLLQQIAMKYDYMGVARFVSRRDQPANNKWFCSELALTALSLAGADILNINPSHASPRDVSISPYLKYIETKVTE